MSQKTDNEKFGRGVQAWLGMIREDGWAGFTEETGCEFDDSAGEVLGLPDFRGDLDWIHNLEGHRGKPYWAEGTSGVTLDPGVDLGHADMTLVARAYAEKLTRAQFAAVDQAVGLRGKDADKWLSNDLVLQSIRISRSEAAEIFPVVAKPYWIEITDRFPDLIVQNPPQEVHTAMLSIAYNRGARNRRLDVLGVSIAEGDWRALGKMIAGMQQDHKLDGIRRRRRGEGALILAAVGG